MQKEVVIILTILCGSFMGLALEKGRIFEPEYIRAQMNFSKFLMLKMFLSAAIFSFISHIIIYYVAKEKFDKLRPTPSSSMRVLVGAAILGIGMTISGSCPGSVYAQLGAGVTLAFVTFIGGVTGAFVLTFVKHPIINSLNFNIKGIDQDYLDKKLKVPFPFVALPMVFMLLLVVLIIEYLFPWTSEYPVNPSDHFPSLFSKSWPPIISGMIIGATQLITSYFLDKSLGCSSSVEFLGYKIRSLIPNMLNEDVKHHSESSMTHMWQVYFVCGSVLGAFVSSVLSGTFNSAASLPIIPSFVGGFLIIFGARIAGGCTSGHGITGFTKLSLPSLLSVPTMFGAAIITSLLFF